MSVAGQVKNDGTDTSPSYDVGYYLSANTTLGSADTLLATESYGSLSGGSMQGHSTTVTIPSSTSAGSWYLFCMVDDGDAVPETDESDNDKYDGITVN